jgi:hypothetical protein
MLEIAQQILYIPGDKFNMAFSTWAAVKYTDKAMMQFVRILTWALALFVMKCPSLRIF